MSVGASGGGGGDGACRTQCAQATGGKTKYSNGYLIQVHGIRIIPDFSQRQLACSEEGRGDGVQAGRRGEVAEGRGGRELGGRMAT